MTASIRECFKEVYMFTTEPLSKKDVRLIRRCCVYPNIATTSLYMALIIGVPFILGMMVGEFVFFGQGDLFGKDDFGPCLIGLYGALAFALSLVGAYCYIVALYGMRGKRWQSLVERLQVSQDETDRTAEAAAATGLVAAGSLLRGSGNEVAQAAGGIATVAGAVDAVAVTAERMAENAGNAYAIADAYGVPIPNVKRAVVAIIAIPLLILAVAFGSWYVAATESINASRTAACGQVELLADAFEGAGISSQIVGDPAQEFRPSGYSVYGLLSGDDFDDDYHRYDFFDDSRYIMVELDKGGLVTEVMYNWRLDTSLSLEENLAQAEHAFAGGGVALSTSNATAKTDALLTIHDLSDEFREQFLAGDIRTEIRLSSEQRYDDYEVNWCFETDEYTQPEILLWIRAR